MRWLKAIAAILWCSVPALLAWVFFILPVLWLTSLRSTGWRYYEDWCPYLLVIVPKNSWLGKVWGARWRGASLPFCVLLHAEARPVTREHEARHVSQWALFGPLFLPLYLALVVGVGYAENPFEADARAYSFSLDRR